MTVAYHRATRTTRHLMPQGRQRPLEEMEPPQLGGRMHEMGGWRLMGADSSWLRDSEGIIAGSKGV